MMKSSGGGPRFSMEGWRSFRRKREPGERERFVRSARERGGVFGGEGLLILAAGVTLLLQVISFLTTWNGARVYLGGIFLLAPLFFALAVQCTVYFLSNSLRVKITPMRVVVLAAAVLCSTYFSYIGIYNTVHSPQRYLEDRYGQIQEDLTARYDARRGLLRTEAKDEVNRMASAVSQQYAALLQEEARIQACRQELEGVSANVTSQLRAPNRGAYDRYEDYAAAYNAYLASISQNTGVESSAKRQEVLSGYGFADQEAFAQAAVRVSSQKQALETSLAGAAETLGMGGETAFSPALDRLRSHLLERMDSAYETGVFSTEDERLLSRLSDLYATAVEGTGNTEVLQAFQRGLRHAGSALMESFAEVSAALPEGKAMEENAMALKNGLDTQVLRAVTTLNSILPEADRLSSDQPDYQIYDLYLLPLRNLARRDTMGMSLFCLLMAALIDQLTILFALVTRRRGSGLQLRRPQSLRKDEEAFAEQVYACLQFCGGKARSAEERLTDFLSRFRMAEAGMKDGYSLQASRQELRDYEAMLAFLCQFNLARVVPVECYRQEWCRRFRSADGELLYPERESPEEEDQVFLKAAFQLWANEKLAELTEQEEEPSRVEDGPVSWRGGEAL